MFKESIYIVLIQIVSFILGFISIYFVAGDMAPEVYSLVGVYSIISVFVLTFSHVGLETVMMREALYWIEIGDNEEVKEYTTQSIVSRIIAFMVLTPLLAGYLYYLSQTKYDGQYLLLFISFIFGAYMNALNDSMSLIIRSTGGFVFSTFARAVNTDILKFIAILVYVKFGAMPYLYFYALYSIPLAIVFYIRLRNNITWKYVKLCPLLKKVIESRYLFLRSYLDYFRTNADAVLVSLIFPAGIMGSYSIFKQLEGIVRSFEDGFFDVLTQKSVRHKCNIVALKKDEVLYNYARLVVSVLVIGCMCIFSFNPHYFVSIVNLGQYEGIVTIIYSVLIVALLILMGKYEVAAMSLFGPSKINFRYGLYVWGVSLLTLLCVVFWQSIEGMLLQRFAMYFISSIIGIVMFRKRRMSFYTNIYK